MQSRIWKKKSIRAFYATFMLWYCLVSINFLFLEVSMRVSYKTFKSCWCQLNHSQRYANCCKGLHRRVPQWLSQVSSSISSCQAAVTCSDPWHTPGTDTGHGHVPTVWAHRPSWAPNTGIRTLKYSLRCRVRKAVQGKSTKNTIASVKRNERGILCVKRADHKLGKPTCKAESAEQLFSRETSTLGSGEPTGHSGTAVPNLHWSIDPFSFYLLTQTHTGVCRSALQTHGTARALRQAKISWRCGRKQTPQNGGLNGWI